MLYIWNSLKVSHIKIEYIYVLGNGGYVTVGIIAYGVLTALFIYLRYILGVNKRDEIILSGDIQFLTIYFYVHCVLPVCMPV